MSSISKDYLQTLINRLKYYKDLGDRTFDQLEEMDFHFALNEDSNSIAMIIKHIAGNMLSRWTNFLTEDGEKEWRDRDREFEESDDSKGSLIELWNRGWECFLAAIGPLKKKDLKKTIYIRQEPLTVIDAINRQLAHYPYHIGQIIYIGKIIKGKNWKNLSIPKGGSASYNNSDSLKDPAKKY
jgi:hypothetical protein